MSSVTVGTLPRISREKLAEMVRAKQPGFTIIDVRDSDFIGGHILGCKNVPVHTHDYKMPELVRTLADQDAVVFHCALSQQRGPASALRYLREREKMSKNGQLAGSDGVKQGQTVYVLEGGFTQWQEIYGEDPGLTEGYVKDLWDDAW
ncbi:hypothetical protein LTR08_004838 [Meristemomyces frigidus]|nr:hypothetical protein LTR08_004838 [Meristemomyces frigidus]